MQITIRGNIRRVRFTKREVACMRLAADLMMELANSDEDAEPAELHLRGVLDCISEDGTYHSPETTPDAAD